MSNTARKSKNSSENEEIEYARSVLKLEADAISTIAANLDNEIFRAIDLIIGMSAEGRVVASGMGKTGFIAQKISATLASIGLPSFFLHPAEAVHGDLGRYSKNDVALMLSNSGETQEIVKILPYLKRIGTPIISISSSRESTLAKHSDVTLCIGCLEEAGPLNVAPTTSTTAMLALGDALCMLLLKRRGLSKQDMAFLHPGGKIGKALTLVSEVMRSGERHCVVDSEMKGRDVLHKVSQTSGRPGATTVIDQNGHLCGIFTDGDLRRCLENKLDFLDNPIKNVTGKNPKTIGGDQLVEEAIRLMSEFKIDQLIVVDADNFPVGMIDIQDAIAV